MHGSALPHLIYRISVHYYTQKHHGYQLTLHNIKKHATLPLAYSSNLFFCSTSHSILHNQHSGNVTYQADRHTSQSVGAVVRRNSRARRQLSVAHCCPARLQSHSPCWCRCRHTSLGCTRCWTLVQCARQPAALLLMTQIQCDASVHCCGNTSRQSSARPAVHPAGQGQHCAAVDLWTMTNYHHYQRRAEYSVSVHNKISLFIITSARCIKYYAGNTM